MVSSLKNLSGGKSVAAMKTPRVFRGDTNQVHSFTAGVTAPNAPTALSGTPAITSVSVSFTAPSDNGGEVITNYQYSLDNVTFTALSPADAVTPVTVSGLTANTNYTLYLKAVNAVGAGDTSSVYSFTSLQAAPATVQYLVIAGGGGGGNGLASNYEGTGGGAGGYRNSTGSETSGRSSSTESVLSVTVGVSNTVTIGNGAGNNSTGSNSVFASITSNGGGAGVGSIHGANGGSGGAGAGAGGTSASGGAGTAGQGWNGGGAGEISQAAGGGGAGGNGAVTPSGVGGIGLASSITGSSVNRAGGGSGSANATGNWGTSGSTGGSGTANTGAGGNGGRGNINQTGGSGGSGVVIIRYLDTFAQAVSTTGSPTYTNTGGYRIYNFTGSGSITF